MTKDIVVDVVEVLTGTDNPRRYWSDLKRKMKAEGNPLYEKIVQLKMQSTDGKYYNTDAANSEQILRIIQSICFFLESGIISITLIAVLF